MGTKKAETQVAVIVQDLLESLAFLVYSDRDTGHYYTGIPGDTDVTPEVADAIARAHAWLHSLPP